MEGQSATEALKQLEELQLPDTPKIAELRNGLLAEVRVVTEYPLRFERLEYENEFGTQYERRTNILLEAGLTTDINGNTIEYPSYETQRARMLEHPELLAKMNRGFVRLQPVPIGAPLSGYLTAVEDGLRQYAKEKRLRATDGTVLQLDDNQPMRKWDAYNGADIDGSLVYEPVQLTTEGHGGKTKTQLIAERGPMQVLLTENLRDIPREGKGVTIGGRPQIEAGKTANRYLQMAGKGPYELESPYALETELAHVLTHLHETGGEVLDDYRSGSGAYCPGTWLPAHGLVPFVCFFRDVGQLSVVGRGPDRPFSDGGVRCAVSGS